MSYVLVPNLIRVVIRDQWWRQKICCGDGASKGQNAYLEEDGGKNLKILALGHFSLLLGWGNNFPHASPSGAATVSDIGNPSSHKPRPVK